MKIIDEDGVRELLQMKELIPAMAAALADLSNKKRCSLSVWRCRWSTTVVLWV